MGVVSCHHALQEVKKLLDNSELSVLQDVLQWRTPRVNTKSMQTSRYIYIYFAGNRLLQEEDVVHIRKFVRPILPA